MNLTINNLHNNTYTNFKNNLNIQSKNNQLNIQNNSPNFCGVNIKTKNTKNTNKTLLALLTSFVTGLSKLIERKILCNSINGSKDPEILINKITKLLSITDTKKLNSNNDNTKNLTNKIFDELEKNIQKYPDKYKVVNYADSRGNSIRRVYYNEMLLMHNYYNYIDDDYYDTMIKELCINGITVQKEIKQ